MNNIIIASTKHPLYEKLAKLSLPFYTIERTQELEIIEDHQNATVWDFTLGQTSQKKELLAKLTGKYDVISDLSCSWGEMLHDLYPRLRASFASAFYSPTSTLEFYADQSLQEDIAKFFNELELKTTLVSSAGHGFIFPRTISMIINEAYFALEDQLASEEDMDKAMRFGVNYPLGPFDWSHKIGLTPLSLLLDDLYSITRDERYKRSHLLQKRQHLP